MTSVYNNESLNHNKKITKDIRFIYSGQTYYKYLNQILYIGCSRFRVGLSLVS
jgi:hypothetical protein